MSCIEQRGRGSWGCLLYLCAHLCPFLAPSSYYIVHKHSKPNTQTSSDRLCVNNLQFTHNTCYHLGTTSLWHQRSLTKIVHRMGHRSMSTPSPWSSIKYCSRCCPSHSTIATGSCWRTRSWRASVHWCPLLSQPKARHSIRSTTWTMCCSMSQSCGSGAPIRCTVQSTVVTRWNPWWRLWLLAGIKIRPGDRPLITSSSCWVSCTNRSDSMGVRS